MRLDDFNVSSIKTAILLKYFFSVQKTALKFELLFHCLL